VIVKKISLPSMSDQELARPSRRSRAAHSVRPGRCEPLTTRFSRTTATSPTMDVLLVAVKKDQVLNYTNVLSMAGKTPAIVDIDALACRIATIQLRARADAGGCPAQPGASVMNINIVKGTTPLFHATFRWAAISTPIRCRRNWISASMMRNR